MDFDYNKLDTETRVTLERHEERFKGCRHDAERNLRQMGYELTTIRKLLLYKSPGFIAWCVAVKFPVSTAYKLIKIVADPKNVAPGGNILILPALSEPQTPDEARMQIEDAAGSKEIVEAIEDEIITPKMMAQAATNKADPLTLEVGAARDVADEMVASEHVTSKDGTQVKPNTGEVVISAVHASSSERAERMAQHIDDNKPLIAVSGSVGDVMRQVADALSGYEGDVRIVVRAASMERVS